MCGQITTVDEAKTFYPLFGLGANVALIVSGRAVKYYSSVRAWPLLPGGPLVTGHCLQARGRSHAAVTSLCVPAGGQCLQVWQVLRAAVNSSVCAHACITGAVAAAARRGRVGVLAEGHDGHGCCRRPPDHWHLLAPAAHRRAHVRTRPWVACFGAAVAVRASCAWTQKFSGTTNM